MHQLVEIKTIVRNGLKRADDSGAEKLKLLLPKNETIIEMLQITKEEQKEVKHYLIDIREPNDTYSVADFQADARKIIDSSELSLICGGTGLYIQSVLHVYVLKCEGYNLRICCFLNMLILITMKFAFHII